MTRQESLWACVRGARGGIRHHPLNIRVSVSVRLAIVMRLPAHEPAHAPEREHEHKTDCGERPVTG